MDMLECKNVSSVEITDGTVEELCRRLMFVKDDVILSNALAAICNISYDFIYFNVTHPLRCQIANNRSFQQLLSMLDNVTEEAFPPLSASASSLALPFWAQFVWGLLFGVMVLVATGGNLIVIWIVLSNQRMKSVTNYFLVNLSVADIMVSTLNAIFNLVFMVSGWWPFGDAYCKFSNFVAVVSVAASVFTMMAISIDRYMAIMFPLRPRMSKMSTLIITFVIWLGSSVLSLPNIMYSTNEFSSEGRSVCYWEWPDGHNGSSYQEHIYNLLIFVLTYVLPMIAIAFSYIKISHELWGSQSIGESTARQVESVKNKRKVVKMMILVVIIFAICWLPYNVYFIITYYQPEINKLDNIQHYYLLIYWLAMSNSMYNPIIYCWMNSRFREGFKSVFSCLPCISVENELPNHNLQYNYGGGSRNDNRNVRYSCSQSADGLVNISLHTLTADVDTETTATNLTMISCTPHKTSIRKCTRHKLLPALFIRKLNTKKPIAV